MSAACAEYVQEDYLEHEAMRAIVRHMLRAAYAVQFGVSGGAPATQEENK